MLHYVHNNSDLKKMPHIDGSSVNNWPDRKWMTDSIFGGLKPNRQKIRDDPALLLFSFPLLLNQNCS